MVRQGVAAPSTDSFMQMIDIVLLIGACLGHITLLSISNNWWFAQALPHRFLSGMRILHGLLVAGGVVGFAHAYPIDFSLPHALSAGNAWHFCGTAYAVLCVVIGWVGLPLVTAVRLLRTPPAVLLGNQTHTIDIAAQLGYKPIGDGKYRAFARLPGNQVFQVDFAERTLCLPRLPAAWDGLSILHVSDLHLCGSPDKIFYQRVMDQCQA
jgi:uncharacterized protein